MTDSRNPERAQQTLKQASIEIAATVSSLGKIWIAASKAGILAIRFQGSEAQFKRELKESLPNENRYRPPVHRKPEFQDWFRQLNNYLDGKSGRLLLPLDVRGTPFQKQVWAALQTIPRGHTITYSELAAKAGRPKAVRAVAGACASNRIAIAIPCHRIIRADGSLGGYRWGTQIKRQLLEIEAALRAI